MTNMPPIVMRETVEVPTGRMNGKIVSCVVEPSTDKKTGKTYNYMNFVVDTGKRDGNWDGKIKFGLNANLSNQSDLGRLLKRLKVPLPVVGEAFNESTLEGLDISFDTVKDGYFTRVVTDSILRA